MDWPGLRSQIQDLPLRLLGWSLSAPRQAQRADQGLASAEVGEREKAMAALAGALQSAAQVGVSLLTLEPGQVPVPGEVGPEDLCDRRLDWTGEQAAAQVARRRVAAPPALDRVCRCLHALAKAHPGATLALRPSHSVFGLGNPDDLEAIFEDLPRVRLGYWHDAALAARRNEVLGEEQGDWLERFGRRLVGLEVADTADAEIDLPPGAGLVDYPLLASYTPSAGAGLPTVLDLNPAIDPRELPGVLSFLAKFGL